MKNFININVDLFRNFLREDFSNITKEKNKSDDVHIRIERNIIKNYMLNNDFLFLYIYYKDKANDISLKITYNMDASILNDVFYKKSANYYIRNSSITTAQKRQKLINHKEEIESNIKQFAESHFV